MNAYQAIICPVMASSTVEVIRQLLAVRCVLHLDDGGRSQCRADNIVCRREVLPCRKSGVAEAHHDILLKRKVGVKRDFVAVPLDVGDGHRDGLLLAGGVSQPELGAVGADIGLLVLGVGEISREGQALVFGLDGGHRTAVDRKRRQNW